ncbi:MAG: CoA ester lyase [Sphaerobacteraceae bacterium]|nr:MAG: CoA ester lyase [Sphaerobacteraceae bacterium]
MRIQRSILSVPGSNWKMIQKGAASQADIALLDLEDAVAPDSKADARQVVIQAFTELDWGDKPRTFRMNALDTPYFYRDLIDIVEGARGTVDLIVVPKVNRPEDVYVVDTILTQIERGIGQERHIRLEAQIETAKGLINCEAIAESSDRLTSLIYGPGDYSASVQMPSTSIGVMDEWDAVYPGHRYQYVMHRILAAARAAGIRAIDGPFANFRDADGHRTSCLMARAMGYDGKWCIHPAQIEVTNELFSPSADDIDWAQRVIKAYEDANRNGLGAVELDNKMIDAANIRMAQATIDQARAAGLLENTASD